MTPRRSPGEHLRLVAVNGELVDRRPMVADREERDELVVQRAVNGRRKAAWRAARRRKLAERYGKWSS